MCERGLEKKTQRPLPVHSIDPMNTNPNIFPPFTPCAALRGRSREREIAIEGDDQERDSGRERAAGGRRASKKNSQDGGCG